LLIPVSTEVLDTQDEVLVQYVEANTPLTPELEERVVESDGQAGGVEGGEGTEGGEEGQGEEGSEGEGEGGDGVNAAGMLAVPVWTVIAVAVAMVM
jgi:5'-nucleotidase